MYNPNRLQQLIKCISCLKEMNLYDDCQKILCVDEHANYWPEDFDVIEIKRPKSKMFNWANVWNAGINQSKFETVLYLDADRILHKEYFELICQHIKDDVFLYSKSLFYVDDINIDQIKSIRDRCQTESNVSHTKLDLRLPCPPNLETLSLGKNCMSGNVAFTKATYLKSGGVDPWYEGYGAADKDYYIQTYKMGFVHQQLNGVELHIKHKPLSNVLENRLMSLYNNIYCARKWNMKLDTHLSKLLDELNVGLDVIDKFTLNDFINNKSKKFHL